MTLLALKRLLALLIACTAWMPAFADGRMFVNGRFPSKVTIFKLTKTQKAYLDLIRRCHSDNARTPYLFRLTRSQSIILRREAGFSPARFAVFESYRGDKAADLEVNVINRFDEDDFEIPHQPLTRDREAHDWEVKTMGWLPNPLTKVNPSKLEASSCPR